MKNLHTEIKIAPSQDKISLGHKILTLGSCFSDVMGQKLSNYKFNCLANPMGVVFNPISIVNLLTSRTINTEHIVEREGMFCYYDYHFDLRSETKKGLIEVINNTRREVISFVEKADWLIVTLGTAYVYELKSDKSIVSNCHKAPQSHFVKRLLTLEEMLSSFDKLFETLRRNNPDLKIILTVSPVRHIKDGVAENQMSKSLLRVLCGTLSERLYVSYFPSYEIMVDELRDYRYYKEDMLHPTEQAEDIIWERFSHTFFDDKARFFKKEWKSILSALNHRPFNPKSKSHQDFIKQQIERLSKIDNRIDTSTEIQLLEAQLIH